MENSVDCSGWIVLVGVANDTEQINTVESITDTCMFPYVPVSGKIKQRRTENDQEGRKQTCFLLPHFLPEIYSPKLFVNMSVTETISL